MELIVYGVHCAWWDSIGKCRVHPNGLPCCPHCGSVLYQVDEKAWWQGVDEHEAQGNPGYRKLVEWMRGRCYPNMKVARNVYRVLNELDDENLEDQVRQMSRITGTILTDFQIKQIAEELRNAGGQHSG